MTKKSETSVKVKQMDIESRKELKQEETNQKFLATREQIFKMLMDSTKKDAQETDAIDV